jgi:hypothetical protein
VSPASRLVTVGRSGSGIVGAGDGPERLLWAIRPNGFSLKASPLLFYGCMLHTVVKDYLRKTCCHASSTPGGDKV